MMLRFALSSWNDSALPVFESVARRIAPARLVGGSSSNGRDCSLCGRGHAGRWSQHVSHHLSLSLFLPGFPPSVFSFSLTSVCHFSPTFFNGRSLSQVCRVSHSRYRLCNTICRNVSSLFPLPLPPLPLQGTLQDSIMNLLLGELDHVVVVSAAVLTAPPRLARKDQQIRPERVHKQAAHCMREVKSLCGNAKYVGGHILVR